MITSEGAVITDEIRPFSPTGRTRLTKSELQDVTFANAFAARAALGIPENFAPLVAGKVPKGSLPSDVIYTADLAGIGANGGLSELDQIVFPDGDSVSFPGVLTPFVAGVGAALTTLPFTILFPRIAFSEEYLNSPPAGGFHLSRYCSTTALWGHVFSVIMYPSFTSSGLQVRHYAPSPPSPGSAYYRVSSDAGMVELAQNPFSLVVVNKKTEAPILYHNGNLLPTTEDMNATGGLPANGWATAVVEGYWILGMNSASSIQFKGSIAPPMTILGAFSDTEARNYGKHGVLPAWATYGTTTNTITSGTLLVGRKYRIIDNSGGANFTAAGAANNDVGTEFVVKILAGVTPTWGSGSVIQLGMLCAPQTSSEGCNVLPDSSGSGKSMVALYGANPVGKRRSDSFHFRLFWNNTHEAKSLYSTDFWKNNRVKIDSITLLASANTTVAVGDGSSGTYFVSSQALVANTPLELTLANKFLGTGLRIVVDPSANYTGTIDVICHYTML